MTIGDRIKFYRCKRKITQNRLAELSDIHVVTIRKYEANKVVPQAAQIKKLANALGVGCLAIGGFEYVTTPIRTVGDFMGILIYLCNLGFWQITGDRGPNHVIRPETAAIKLNPNLSSVLLGKSLSSGKKMELDQFVLLLRDIDELKQVLSWEYMSYLCKQYEQLAEESQDEFSQEYQHLMEAKEKGELILQDIPLLLNTGSHLSVMVNPDY